VKKKEMVEQVESKGREDKDYIHEDLNRVKKKKVVEQVENRGREDKAVALESWKNFLKRNQSIVVDLMTGQYKSKVVCPECSLSSITFDPFTTVSLPLRNWSL
jgi:ubiquitin carboxyl-terminal hydrolase 4/11/15